MALSFSEKLLRYKKEHALTQHEMAQRLGISDRMYQYYERGDFDGNPSKVRKYLERLNNPNAGKQVAYAGPGTPVFDVSATAGEADNVNQLSENPAFHVNIPGYEDCNFGMYVYGHSMYPTIESGSLILCRKVTDKSVILFGEVYLIRTKDYLMVKRLQKGEQRGTVLCTSDNFEQRNEKFRRFEPFNVALDKIIDIYIVKGIIKKTQS